MEFPICSKMMGGCGHLGIGQKLRDWKKEDNCYECPKCKNITIVELNNNNVRLHIQDEKELKKALVELCASETPKKKRTKKKKK